MHRSPNPHILTKSELPNEHDLDSLYTTLGLGRISLYTCLFKLLVIFDTNTHIPSISDPATDYILKAWLTALSLDLGSIKFPYDYEMFSNLMLQLSNVDKKILNPIITQKEKILDIQDKLLSSLRGRISHTRSSKEYFKLAINLVQIYLLLGWFTEASSLLKDNFGLPKPDLINKDHTDLLSKIHAKIINMFYNILFKQSLEELELICEEITKIKNNSKNKLESIKLKGKEITAFQGINEKNHEYMMILIRFLLLPYILDIKKTYLDPSVIRYFDNLWFNNAKEGNLANIFRLEKLFPILYSFNSSSAETATDFILKERKKITAHICKYIELFFNKLKKKHPALSFTLTVDEKYELIIISSTHTLENFNLIKKVLTNTRDLGMPASVELESGYYSLTIIMDRFLLKKLEDYFKRIYGNAPKLLPERKPSLRRSLPSTPSKDKIILPILLSKKSGSETLKTSVEEEKKKTGQLALIETKEKKIKLVLK